MNKTFDPTKPITKVLEVHTKAVEPTDAQLERIKPFLLRDFAARELYVREMELANDQHDRSGERFDMGYLRRFAQTAVGKSVMTGHEYGSAPIGRFFDSRVGKGANEWNWLVTEFYMPRSPGNELARDNIDSGVWSHVSIGASVDYAGLICDICGRAYYPGFSDEDDGLCPHILHESYDGQKCTATWTMKRSDPQRVEMVEGSVVYLGCQYAAAIAKTVEQAEEMRDAKRAGLGLPSFQATPFNPGPVLIKPYPSEHACRLRDPADFQSNSFRRVSRDHQGKRYDVIMGRLTGETTMSEQAYRYPKDVWEVADARTHCRSHHGISFEPASSEESACPTCDAGFRPVDETPHSNAAQSSAASAARRQKVEIMEQLKRLFGVESEEAVIEAVKALQTRIEMLEPQAADGVRLKGELVEEIRRLAKCTGDEIVPMLVDKITEIDELNELRRKLEKTWGEMRGIVVQADGNPETETVNQEPRHRDQHSVI